MPKDESPKTRGEILAEIYSYLLTEVKVPPVQEVEEKDTDQQANPKLGLPEQDENTKR